MIQNPSYIYIRANAELATNQAALALALRGTHIASRVLYEAKVVPKSEEIDWCKMDLIDRDRLHQRAISIVQERGPAWLHTLRGGWPQHQTMLDGSGEVLRFSVDKTGDLGEEVDPLLAQAVALGAIAVTGWLTPEGMRAFESANLVPEEVIGA